MKDQIANHVKSSRRYRHPKGGSIRPNPRKEQKGVTRRYYQHLSGHAATGPTWSRR